MFVSHFRAVRLGIILATSLHHSLCQHDELCFVRPYCELA
jgi:hypothetical protein